MGTSNVKRSLITFVAALCISAAAGAQSATISIGRTDSIWSPTLKEWRRFEVYLPPGYDKSAYQPRAYPVLYVLDGSTHFHSITGAVQFLSTGGNGNYVIPEMVVVAIPNTNRTRDLTPTHAIWGPRGDSVPEFDASGGGGAFLAFLQAELVPHVDSAFRTEPYRILVGHSFGGITAINVMYTMPGTFNAYIVIDPSLWWDHRVLVRKAAAALANPALRGRTLFIAQANTVDLADTAPEGPCIGARRSPLCADTTWTSHFRAIRDFDRLVRAGAASQLRYAFHYYPGDDHGSVPLIAEYDALRFIFSDYRVDFDKKMTGADLAAHFAEVSRTLGYPVRAPEKILNMAPGLFFVDTASAVSVARYYAEQYPNSPHAFDVLGGVLLAVRDTAGAVQAYQRALAGDSANTRIRDILARLKP